MAVLKKINAGALQFVLFVGAVIAVLLMSFLLLTYTHKHFEQKTDILVQLLQSANYGIEASLSEDFPQGQKYQIYNESDIPIHIDVKREFWGIFEKRIVETTHNNTSYSKIALIGGKDKGEIAALYLNDNQRPVILAGNSQITGNAFLPEQGLKMGNIYGNSYNKSALLYGKQMKSKATLPKLSEELKKQINLISDTRFLPEGEMMTSLPKSVIKNSFESETKIYKGRTVSLENIEITGNVIIIAEYKIIVKSSARLQDILLVSPEIVIEDEVKGNFQAVATTSITVGKKTELSYPSALVLHKKNNTSVTAPKNNATPNQQAAILLDTNSYIAGCIIALDADTTKSYTPLVKISSNTEVLGEVYCAKNLELKGIVNGMVSTDGFIALENGSIYQNHLYDGVINSTNLNSVYTGILLQSRVSNKKLMKWLY